MTTTPPSDRPPVPGGPRRRRRGGRGGGPGRQQPTPAAPKPLVPEVSRLAEPAAPADDRLTRAEVAEMKEHLAFLRTYKDILRLKLNAAEDLLVNGQREPVDRGVCKHLLVKVDRAAIEGAITREPMRSDPAARARLLGRALPVPGHGSV